MAIEVTVYSPPEYCQSCRVTKLRLNSLGVPFENVVASDEQVAAFKSNGLLSWPIVVVDVGDGATWTFCGYRHDDINRVKELFAEKVTLGAIA